jgi:hypothetical protein
MLVRLLRTLPALCLAGAILSLAAPARAQGPGVQLGFCPGAPGHVATVTITVVIACPTPITLTATAVGPCDDAAAFMAAVDAAMAGLNVGGVPIFDPPVAVGGGVAGQDRHEYPLSPAFLFNTNCDFLSIDIDFDCGTMGMAVLIPGCHGCPGLVRPLLKLSVHGPPPGPSSLAIKIAGCPMLIVPLDGTETAAGVAAKVLAALLAAGYAAHIDADGRVVIDLDCTGHPPTGIDEYGLVGGLPMSLDMGSVPPDRPTPARHGTWGAIKTLYR